jgi:hypothetical protein
VLLRRGIASAPRGDASDDTGRSLHTTWHAPHLHMLSKSTRLRSAVGAWYVLLAHCDNYDYYFYYFYYNYSYCYYHYDYCSYYYFYYYYYCCC